MGLLGDRLRIAREAKGWTQVYVAKILDITSQALSNYERGDRDPDTPLLKQLSEIYEVSSDYLLGLSDDPSPHQKIETIAAHRSDDPMTELPEEARRSVEEFIDYIYKKYAPDKAPLYVPFLMPGKFKMM